MKQIKFFASVAAIALASSCANDELQPMQPEVPSSERPAANFVLSVNEDVFETTRAAFGPGAGGYSWTFEEGDKIGAMLMDTWDGRGEGPANFSIVDYAHTNYPVIKNAIGEWESHEDINQLAGNYFFYFPYEPVTNARGNFGFSVNPKQPQFKDGKFNYWAAVEANQRYLGYDFVPVKDYTGEKTNVKVDFAPLFAMPAFEFLNKAGDLIVDKVVVRATESLEADMYDKNKNQLIATTMAFLPGSGNFDSVKSQWVNNDGDLTNETNLLWNHAMKYTSGGSMDETYQLPSDQGMSWTPSANFYPLNKTFISSYIDQAPAYEYEADYTGVEGGHVVKQFEYIRAILVMPAGSYDVDGFEAMIHVRPVGNPTDRYVVRIPLDLMQDGQFDDNQQTAGHDYLVPGKTSKFYGAFDATAMKSYDITKSQITSSEDLLWMINEANEFTGDYKLTVNTSGKRVVLTKEIEEALTAKPNVHLYINGKITIADNTSENAINLLHFDNNAMSTDLTILNKQVAKKTVSNLSKLTVESTAELIAGTISVWSGESEPINYANLYNNGKIECTYLSACGIKNNGSIKLNKLNNVVESDNQVYVQGLVENRGTIDVATTIRLVKNNAKVDNYNTLTTGNIKANGAKPAYVVNVNNEAGTLTVSGTIEGNITNKATATAGAVTKKADNKSGATLTITKSVFDLVNAGITNVQGAISNTAENSGTINVTGTTSAYKFNNAATGTINVNAVLTENTTLTNNGTVNVAAGAEILAPGQGNVNNAGTINVEGKLKENVYSNGVINVKGNGIVIAKKGTGIIDVTNANNKDAAHAAKSNSSDMYFRYTVNVDNGKDLKENELQPRISAENFEKNRIILVWDATSPAKYQGGTSVVASLNVTDVIINRELLLDGNTGFEDAVKVAINKQVTVGNGTKEAGFNCGRATVTISSVLKVNNHGKLTGNAKYTGSGIIEMLGADSTISWTAATGSNVKVNM